jgi:hypothetical protein
METEATKHPDSKQAETFAAFVKRSTDNVTKFNALRAGYIVCSVVIALIGVAAVTSIAFALAAATAPFIVAILSALIGAIGPVAGLFSIVFAVSLPVVYDEEWQRHIGHKELEAEHGIVAFIYETIPANVTVGSLLNGSESEYKTACDAVRGSAEEYLKDFPLQRKLDFVGQQIAKNKAELEKAAAGSSAKKECEKKGKQLAGRKEKLELDVKWHREIFSPFTDLDALNSTCDARDVAARLVLAYKRIEHRVQKKTADEILPQIDKALKYLSVNIYGLSEVRAPMGAGHFFGRLIDGGGDGEKS